MEDDIFGCLATANCEPLAVRERGVAQINGPRQLHRERSSTVQPSTIAPTKLCSYRYGVVSSPFSLDHALRWYSMVERSFAFFVSLFVLFTLMIRTQRFCFYDDDLCMDNTVHSGYMTLISPSYRPILPSVIYHISPILPSVIYHIKHCCTSIRPPCARPTSTNGAAAIRIVKPTSATLPWPCQPTSQSQSASSRLRIARWLSVVRRVLTIWRLR